MHDPIPQSRAEALHKAAAAAAGDLLDRLRSRGYPGHAEQEVRALSEAMTNLRVGSATEEASAVAALRRIIAGDSPGPIEYEDWGGDTGAAERWGLRAGYREAANVARAALQGVPLTAPNPTVRMEYPDGASHLLELDDALDQMAEAMRGDYRDGRWGRIVHPDGSEQTVTIEVHAASVVPLEPDHDRARERQEDV